MFPRTIGEYAQLIGESKEIPILWRNEEYLLIGNMDKGGAITTKELYANFQKSIAHLYPDGEIRRFGVLVGHKEDITVIE